LYQFENNQFKSIKNDKDQITDREEVKDENESSISMQMIKESKENIEIIE